MPPDSRLTARILGYSIVLCAIAVLVYWAAYFNGGAGPTGRTFRVAFPEVSTLSAGDAVVENGVAVGAVDRIVLEEGAPVAFLRIPGGHFVAEDARFVNFSHSLMGARKVWLLPGTSARPMDPGRLHAGAFAPGLPETLHKVGELTALVVRLRAEAERAFADSGIAAEARLGEALRALDRASSALDDAGSALRAGTGAFASANLRAEEAVSAATPRVEGALRRGEEALLLLAGTHAALDTVVAGAERLAAALEDSAGAGRLLADRGAYEALVRQVRALESVARALDATREGKDIRVNPRLR